MVKKRGGGGGGGGGGHDGGGGMRWLLTYSDLITLLMVFFVVMFAISSADQKKFGQLRGSLQSALRTEGGGGASLIFAYPGEKIIDLSLPLDNTSKETKDFNEIIERVQSNIDPSAVSFAISERGLTIRFMDSVLFDSGIAELRPDSLKLLEQVGASLKGVGNYIRIEGHADNVPINTAQYPSNWELSSARSIAVTRYLIDRSGMDPRRLSSLGFGEHRPLFANNSPENRSKNRRVDIIVLRTDRAGGEDDTASNPPAAKKPVLPKQ